MSRKYDWSKEKAFRVDDDGCLLWRGTVHSDGDPIIYDTSTGRRRYISVRRSLLAMVKGRPLARAERTISICGKKLCCNPYCLRAVSFSEVCKATAERTGYPQSYARRIKISESQQKRHSNAGIAEIRARAAAGEDRNALCAEYGISRSRLYNITSHRARVVHLPQSERHALSTRRSTCT